MSTTIWPGRGDKVSNVRNVVQKVTAADMPIDKEFLGEKVNDLRGGRRCLGSFARRVYELP
jgi:hypothetical protein